MTPDIKATDATVGLDLTRLYNNVGSTLPGVRESLGFDGYGRTYPAEELTALAPLLGAPVPRWGEGGPDNVACDAQVVDLPSTLILDGWSIIGACDGGSAQDAFTVRAEDGGATTVRVGLTDIFAHRAAFTDECALVCSRLREDGLDVSSIRPRLWRARQHFAEPVRCSRIVFPMNPVMHVFAVQLEVRV